MFVKNINLSQKCISNKQRCGNSTISQSKGQSIAFSAQRYPSGHYSDWFVKLLKSKINESDEKFIEWMEHKVTSHELWAWSKRLNTDFMHALFYPNTKNSKADAAIRKQDYQNLRSPLNVSQESNGPRIFPAAFW